MRREKNVDGRFNISSDVSLHSHTFMKAHIRSISWVGISIFLVLLAGCSRPPQTQPPLVSGQIILCVLGDKPVMRAGETGTWSGRNFQEGRVDIYERVIVITDKDGTKHCAPHDWFKEVTFK